MKHNKFILLTLLFIVIGVSFYRLDKCTTNKSRIVGIYLLKEYSDLNHKESLILLNNNKYIHEMRIYRKDADDWESFKNYNNWSFDAENCKLILTDFQYKSVMTKKIEISTLICTYYNKKILVEIGYEFQLNEN